MTRVLIVVEGQTEEGFVKNVLAPHLSTHGIYLTPTIVATKIVKDGPNFKGGITNFPQFREHLSRVLNGGGGALVTTLIDYYGLPSDFPGMISRPVGGTPLQRVVHVQQSLHEFFGNVPNFLPFIALHEYEAWLFSDAETVPRLMAMTPHAAFAALANGTAPEEINEHPATAPSKRLLAMFKGYRKVVHGPLAASRIGLPTIRQKCPHFDQWITTLEIQGAIP